jgi:hypothetical protein
MTMFCSGHGHQCTYACFMCCALKRPDYLYAVFLLQPPSKLTFSTKKSLHMHADYTLGKELQPTKAAEQWKATVRRIVIVTLDVSLKWKCIPYTEYASLQNFQCSTSHSSRISSSKDDTDCTHKGYKVQGATRPTGA